MKYQGLTLDPFQEEAVRYIEDGHSVLVAAPTGTGKTLIADYLVEEIIEDGGEIIYTAPVKALSNQKYREYSELLGSENVGLVTGDLVINRDAPLRIMTTEILRNMLLEGGHGGMVSEQEVSDAERQELLETASPSDTRLPEIDRLKAVVIDEIHFLDDEDRGTVWEELLIYLPTRVRILGLSATASNLSEVAGWLSQIRETDVKVVREEQRAVPLHLSMGSIKTGVVSIKQFNKAYGQWKKFEKDGEDKKTKKRGRKKRSRHKDLFEMLPDESLPALYFIYSRKMVERLSTQLSKDPIGRHIGQMADRRELQSRIDRFHNEYPDVLTGRLRRILQQGIAFHHAGMHVAFKALVEELYEARLIKVLYCTSTFALGINMPARTVIFDSLMKFNGTDFVPLTIREFMQMAGRAGRRGIDEVGEVVIRQDFDDYHEVRGLLRRLTSEKSEPVESSFNLSFYSVANLLNRFDTETIRSLLEQSFKAYQSQQRASSLEDKIAGSEAPGADAEGSDDISPDRMRRRRTSRRKLASLKRQLAEEQRPRMWEEFQRKVSFLQSHGYVDPQNRLEPAAHILRHIKIEEIFLTEMILAGVLEDLSPDELFGVMTGLVQTLPRKARVNKPRDDKWWAIFADINAIYESDIVADAEFLVDAETVFTPELMPLGEMWATGEPLSVITDEIQNNTDISGDIVGAFRRAKDLVSQLRDVHYEDEVRRRELTRLIRKVTRDEVQVLD